MINIVFVCHGNICRSAAAEYIAKDYSRKYGLVDKVVIISRATSTEEIGNDIYPPMKRLLQEYNIEIGIHSATLISNTDCENADYIFYMDQWNMHNLNRMFPFARNKMHCLCDFGDGTFTEIEDPWYTGGFKTVYDELSLCIRNFFDSIK